MPVNPARHARHLKQVKKVQDAIRYRDKTLEKLQPIKKKKFETKQYFIQQNRVQAEVTHANIRTARNNAREDWDLGPLRPNRAVGEEAETRGIYNREGLRDVPLPKHWLGSGDEVQRKVKTRLPENVLRNQWPIVEGDRVVIIRGLHKNKIGVVKELHKNENMVTVEGLNKIYADADWMTINQETEERKKEMEKPLSFDDVRLVVAWFGANGTRKDVIIDKVRMERHSTGINPFTGEETGVDPETGEPIVLETDPETGEEIHQEAAIPEEQQVDPNTGDPLYHRYVGYGSKFHRIPWPWEMDKLKQQKEQKKAAKNHVEEEEEDKGLVKRTTGKVKSLLGRKEDNKPKPAAAAEEEQDDPEETRIALEKLAFQAPMRPPQEDFADFDDDTTLNTVEIKLGNFDNPGHFIPTLVTPPHPLSVYDEIREMDLAENGPSPEERQMQREMAYVAPPQQNKAPLPKTPRQVFTELRLAKKKAERPEVIPFMGGLSREERKLLHQRFGLNLAEQFALRLQGETAPRVGKVEAEPEMPKVDAELLRAMEGAPELTDKNV